MKKFIAVVFFAIVIISLFTGCSNATTNENEQAPEQENNGRVEVSTSTNENDDGLKLSKTYQYGDIYLFETRFTDQYLLFLENFDYTNFEIVDISTSMYVYDSSGEFYMVTYKVK